MKDNGAPELDELDESAAAELPGDDPNRANDDADGDPDDDADEYDDDHNEGE